MTKAEYLNALREKLESFNRELQNEIMEDYERHFAEGMAEGRSEEEIIEELGNIEDMIQELPEEDMKQEIGNLEPVEAGRQRSDIFRGEHRAVVIDGLVADVTVETSEDGNIHVDYRNDGDTERYRFFQYEEDGVFHAGVKERSGFGRSDGKRDKKVLVFGKTVLAFRSYSSGGDDITLQIRIPDGMPEVSLMTTSGDVKLYQVSVGSLKASTSSGEMEAGQVSAAQADMTTVSGGLQIDQMTASWAKIGTFSGDVELKHFSAETMSGASTSGDIRLSGGTFGEMQLHTGSGDMEFYDIKAGKIHLQAGSGDIKTKQINGEELYAQTGSGDVDISGNMVRYMLRTGSGDAVLKAEKEARRVRVETGSGDAVLDMTGADGVEVRASVGSGDGVIYGADGTRRHLSYGSCCVGSGECKVTVTAGSGDLVVRC